MTITPNEIINKEFKKTFRGYDIDEVDEFLEQLSEDYEKLYKENLNLKEKIEALNEKLSHYVNLESTLQNTLLLAQSAADQAKESSKKEAELIIKNAQEAANELVKKAEERVLEINKEYEILKNEYNMFKSRFRALLQSELENLDKEYITNEK
ncbi:DivIVA domain-containing protein [Caloramator proteoclasticus]|uniref:Cell division initiation protein n=1 Tax=Caloramator proteoclasticus DSM 10124 TaxID=1121262 RepID=A0A1M4UGJ8_9CLOT|nr:DivIVA domain-containing protein [Caloramator proteoclasticus]SHE55700.1 cell division initiation protein [Caloramator proteoclasticus DSM 10124]